MMTRNHIEQNTLVLKLQLNFDLIEYLIKNASDEQLAWCKDKTHMSLGKIICHLYEMEISHARAISPNIDCQNQISGYALDANEKNHSDADYKQMFEQYACHHRKTISLLQNLPSVQWQCPIIHQRFGEISLAKLVEKIEEFEQAKISQLQDIIQNMPLNPLMARALDEIRNYHQHYQPYMAQATYVLDIGVGSGLVLQHVIEQNPDICFVGVDIHDSRRPDINVPLLVYDGYTLPFSQDQFDVSFLFYVLHHCQDPHHLLTEAIRVTYQKLIIIEEFSLPNANPASLNLTERQSLNALGTSLDSHYLLFDKIAFEQVLVKCNLIPIEQRLLASETTRPVQKYMYVVDIRN